MASKRKYLAYNMTYIAMCVALLSICAWITIPFTVSFTLQLFAVFWIAAVSDWKQSLSAISLYLLLGGLGAPIFSGFQGGPGVFLSATGGYLIGFLCASLVISLLIQLFGKKSSVLIASMSLSLLICYFFGTLWYIVFYATIHAEVSVLSALFVCVFPFLVPDCLKIALAVILAKKLEPYLLRLKP